ncbi:uncharacterized protein NEMAJ01_2039 [Nematocida major]|uniref:uncharacterized protein n=1 Tax=Nematocida major TaxID=1912982 RepID=UPI002007D0F8|nr:uncharacterized protein NEMAJ01_2039 [Nematocida major]KAH9387143.1 hypothetical protein NEMAJ01_2039 [Nematocida major]
MHAKFYALMLAALARCAHARISFDQVVEIQGTEIGNSKAFINPRGPLCLLRGFVYSELGYMHNKRFFSPEIETDYKLEPVGDAKKTWRHMYTRNVQNDKPYPPAEGPALGFKSAAPEDYAVAYHRALIEMFPSVDGHALSVTVGRKDSFFKALQRMPTKHHAHCVLAALLLLSEGVDVPITTTPEEISLQIDGIAFQEKACEKAALVIDFFKDNRGKGKLPCTPEAFSTGDFLNTPQFLIQAYVFEYITSQDDALDFAACAHVILKGLPENVTRNVYSACFVESKAEAEEDKILRPLRVIQERMKILQTFPFTSRNMLPAYTSVHVCKRGQRKLLSETFSNCVEAGLLALFCCLAHDPALKKYDADAMLGKKKEGDKTEALRTFFQLKGVTPKACATKETMQEWNYVVSALQSEHIAYVRKSRNELCSGFFNALYVVAETTGRREQEEPRIRELAQVLEGCKIGKASEDVFEKTLEYAAELFASLSVDKSLKVEVSNLKVDAWSDGQKDLYGTITLKYTDKDSVIEQGICLESTPKHLAVALCPWTFLSSATGEEEAFFAVDGYSDPADFVECLLAGYADAWRARGMDTQKDMDTQESMLSQGMREAAGRLAESGASAHPNELFLLGNPLRCEQIKEFAKHFTLHAAAKGFELAQEHPGVRLLSNMLGSLPLDDDATQIAVLQHIVSLDMLGELYPRIALSKNITAIIYKNLFTTIRIGRYTGDNCAPAANAIMKYFREYKDKANRPFFLCSELKGFVVASDLFPALLADKSTRCIDEIGALIVDVEKEDQRKALDTKAIFDLLVFLASLKHKDTLPEMVPVLGSRLGPRSIQACSGASHRPYIKSQEASALLEALNTHRSALSQTPSGAEVFNGVVGILQFNIDQNQ